MSLKKKRKHLFIVAQYSENFMSFKRKFGTSLLLGRKKSGAMCVTRDEQLSEHMKMSSNEMLPPESKKYGTICTEIKTNTPIFPMVSAVKTDTSGNKNLRKVFCLQSQSWPWFKGFSLLPDLLVEACPLPDQGSLDLLPVHLGVGGENV